MKELQISVKVRSWPISKYFVISDEESIKPTDSPEV
jgi:hypothetical protein